MYPDLYMLVDLMLYHWYIIILSFHVNSFAVLDLGLLVM